jgi:hypothetical protein
MAGEASRAACICYFKGLRVLCRGNRASLAGHGWNTVWLSIACLVLCLWAAQAQATPITTLYNTGVDDSHAVLADGPIGDPHYALNSVPIGSRTAIRVVTSASSFPAWVGDNQSSRWIGPNNSLDHNGDMSGPQGGYIYQTTFSLGGLNPTTAPDSLLFPLLASCFSGVAAWRLKKSA